MSFDIWFVLPISIALNAIGGAYLLSRANLLRIERRMVRLHTKNCVELLKWPIYDYAFWEARGGMGKPDGGISGISA